MVQHFIERNENDIMKYHNLEPCHRKTGLKIFVRTSLCFNNTLKCNRADFFYSPVMTGQEGPINML